MITDVEAVAEKIISGLWLDGRNIGMVVNHRDENISLRFDIINLPRMMSVMSMVVIIDDPHSARIHYASGGHSDGVTLSCDTPDILAEAVLTYVRDKSKWFLFGVADEGLFTA